MKTLTNAISINKEIFGSEEQKKALVKAVLKLPEDQQKILILHFSQQLAIKEISVELHCSATTIYTKLNRALFTLRNEFNPAAYRKMYDILYPETGQPIYS